MTLENKNVWISRGFNAVTSLLLAFVVFYGKGIVESDNRQNLAIQNHETRLSVRESNAYTQDEAHADYKVLDGRIRAMETTTAGMLATLQSIDSQISLLRQDVRDQVGRTEYP